MYSYPYEWTYEWITGRYKTKICYQSVVYVFPYDESKWLSLSGICLLIWFCHFFWWENYFQVSEGDRQRGWMLLFQVGYFRNLAPRQRAIFSIICIPTFESEHQKHWPKAEWTIDLNWPFDSWKSINEIQMQYRRLHLVCTSQYSPASTPTDLKSRKTAWHLLLIIKYTERSYVWP